MRPFEIVGLALLLCVGCFVALGAIGFYVVKHYPNKLDPARNARRFTLPAGILAATGTASGIVTLAALTVGVIVALS